MKILIVDDSASKYKSIEAVLKENFSCSVEWVRNVSSSFRVISESYDLIVLDMNFQPSPSDYGGGGRSETAGIKVLQFMIASGIRVPVIVATSYTSFKGLKHYTSVSELNDDLTEAFPPLFVGTVNYSSEGWQNSLVDKITKCQDK